MWIIFDFSKCSSPDSEFAPTTSKNGAPTRISEPMAEQWIDPTAREIKVGEVVRTCLTQRPHHCLSSSNPRIKRNDVLFSQHFPGQTPLNNWPFCANGRVPCHLSQGHIEFTAIPADRTDEPKRTIELEWVDRIWSTRECVQHVDAYAQIGACWNRRFTTKLLRRTCKRLEISGTNSDNGKGRRYCTHPQLLNYCFVFFACFG